MYFFKNVMGLSSENPKDFLLCCLNCGFKIEFNLPKGRCPQCGAKMESQGR